MRTPGEFATALFGHELPEGTLVQTWTLRDKRSGWWRAAQGLDSLAGREDAFIGVSLTAKDYGPRRRMPAADSVGIGGLWLDIDVIGGPKQRDHGAPSKADALRVGSAVLPPTVVVDSGWGIHTWHLLPTVWRFRSYDEQRRAADLAARWYALHAQIAAEAGWHLDQSTRDLARIMRLPGTVNTKGGQRVEVAVIDFGPRHELDVLAAKTSEIEPVSIPLGGGSNVTARSSVGELRLTRGAAPPADKLHALRVNSPEFEAVWTRQRPEFRDDQSRYDLALADLAVAAGWSAQEIAVLVGAHRGWDPKAFRRDYLERTIGRARSAGVTAA